MPAPSSNSIGPELALALQRVALGDPLARDHLVALCGLRMLAHANRMLAGFPGAGQCREDDDAVVAALQRFHAVLRSLQHVPPRFAVALAAATIRRVVQRLVPADCSAVPPFAARDDESLRTASRDRWTRFFEAVDRLPALHREVFHLVWFMGADERTVSRLTGRSRHTVRQSWRQARTSLQRTLRRF